MLGSAIYHARCWGVGFAAAAFRLSARCQYGRVQIPVRIGAYVIRAAQALPEGRPLDKQATQATAGRQGPGWPWLALAGPASLHD